MHANTECNDSVMHEHIQPQACNVQTHMKLHGIALHYMTLHYIALHYATVTMLCSEQSSTVIHFTTYITYTHTSHACTPTYLHKGIHTYLHAYIPTYLHTYIHTYIHTYVPTYLNTYLPAYKHTLTTDMR